MICKNNINLFDDANWVEKVEQIKAQFEDSEETVVATTKKEKSELTKVDLVEKVVEKELATLKMVSCIYLILKEGMNILFVTGIPRAWSMLKLRKYGTAIP